MLHGKDLEDWLTNINRRLASEEVPHRVRPFHALSEYTKTFNCVIQSSHPIAKAIFDWFYRHSPPGAHHMGSMYVGVFYYDVAFWPVSVPLVFGEAQVDALGCLITMPDMLKEQLSESDDDASIYATHWVNCMDYAYGYDEVRQSCSLTSNARSLLSAADADLRGAISQLLEHRSNAKAILGFRMATEISFKAVLAERASWSEKQLKAVGHNLADAAMACWETTELADFSHLGGNMDVYPPVSARYEAPKWTSLAIWEAVAVTQYVMATVTRSLGGQDSRAILTRRGTNGP